MCKSCIIFRLFSAIFVRTLSELDIMLNVMSKSFMFVTCVTADIVLNIQCLVAFFSYIFTQVDLWKKVSWERR